VQDRPGNCLSIISNTLKGGVTMVKTMSLNAGFKTALVVFGWLAFFGAFFINEPFICCALQTIARVLP